MKSKIDLRKKILFSVLIFIFFAISVTYFSGPVQKINYEIAVPEINGELKKYVRSSEKNIPFLKDWNKKQIIYDSYWETKTDYVIIYLHDFGASKMDINPIIPRMGEILGANVYLARLTGHGQVTSELKKAKLNDWVNDAVESYLIGSKLGKNIILVGNGLGACLATWLVLNGYDVDKLVLFSPSFSPRDTLLKNPDGHWGKFLAKKSIGKEKVLKVKNQEHQNYWTQIQPFEPLFQKILFCEYLTETYNFSRINIPTMILYNERDRNNDIEEIKTKFGQIGTTDKKLYNVKGANGKHLAGYALSVNTTMDVFYRVYDFLKPKEKESAGSKIGIFEASKDHSLGNL